MNSGKNLSDDVKLFFRKDYQKNKNILSKQFRDKQNKKQNVSLHIKLKQIDEIKNIYIFEGIKHNYLIIENHENVQGFKLL